MTEAVSCTDSILQPCSSTRAVPWRFLMAMLISITAWGIAVPVSFPGAICRWNEQAVPSNAPLFGMAFAICALIARKRMLRRGKRSHRWLGWCLGSLPLAAAIGWLWQSAEAAHYASLLAMVLMIAIVGGRNWLRTFWPTGLFLLLCSGLPASWVALLIDTLQQYGVWITHQFCQIFLDHSYAREGACITLIKPFFEQDANHSVGIVVAEQCVGYKSLVGMAMLSLLYATAMQLPRNKKIAIIVLGPTLAILFNTARLLLSTCFIHHGLHRLTGEVPHALLGHVLMGLEAALLYLLARKWQLLTPATPFAQDTTTSQKA